MGLFGRRRQHAESISEPFEAEESGQSSPEQGPYDESEAPAGENLVDIGALRLPEVPGADLQFSVDRNRKRVLGAVYQIGESAVQVQAFAAPKTATIWDSVRADVAQSIAAQGGRFTEAEGQFGKELRAMMPGPDKSTRIPVRFIGIDGPRWLLRVGLTGKAALDNDEAAKVSHEVLDQLVVVRGSRPLPARELIPMTLPGKEGEDSQADADGDPTVHLPGRGPEISEVR